MLEHHRDQDAQKVRNWDVSTMRTWSALPGATAGSGRKVNRWTRLAEVGQVRRSSPFSVHAIVPGASARNTVRQFGSAGIEPIQSRFAAMPEKSSIASAVAHARSSRRCSAACLISVMRR
jgi:hypothetical protein